jgi:hypothetical protein
MIIRTLKMIKCCLVIISAFIVQVVFAMNGSVTPNKRETFPRFKAVSIKNNQGFKAYITSRGDKIN